MNSSFIATVFLVVLILPGNPLAAPPQIAGCPVFPSDNIWNAPVDNLPLDPNSAAYINTIGANGRLHPDFGAPYLAGEELVPIGIPFNIVSSTEPLKDVYFGYVEESDAGPYPIPENPLIEGILPGEDQDVDGDRHILIVDQDSCILYEMFYSWPRQDGSWDAGSGAILTSIQINSDPMAGHLQMQQASLYSQDL